MESSRKGRITWPFIIGIVLAVAVSAQVAFGSLTFSPTTISGDGPVIIDGSSTISIGTSTATGITIGQTGQTVLFPGSVSSTNLFAGNATITNALSLGSPSTTATGAFTQYSPDSLTSQALYAFSDTYYHGFNGRFYRAEGTIQAPSPPQADDYLGAFRFNGYDGANYDEAAALVVQATEPWNSTHQGTNLFIETTPIGTATRDIIFDILPNQATVIGAPIDSQAVNALNAMGSFCVGQGTGGSFCQTAAPVNGAIFEGGVAIGTSTPAAFLDVEGTGGAILNAGNVGIGTRTPSTTLQVAGASSTIRIGTPALPGCLEMGNSNGSAGMNYITVLSGVLSATTTKPSACQ